MLDKIHTTAKSIGRQVSLKARFVGAGAAAPTRELGSPLTVVRNGVGDLTFTVPGKGGFRPVDVRVELMSADTTLVADVVAMDLAARTFDVALSDGMAHDLAATEYLFVSVTVDEGIA